MLRGTARVVRVAAIIGCLRSVSAAQPEPEPQHQPDLVVPAVDDHPKIETKSDDQRLSPRADVVMTAVSSTTRADLAVTDWTIKAAAPLLIGDGYGSALLVDYSQTRIDLPGAGQLVLHRTQAGVGGGAGLAPGWSLRGSVQVAYASDLADPTYAALQVTSSAMVHHVVSSSDAFVLGLVYCSTSDLIPYVPVIPLVGWVHQAPGSRFRFDAFLPHHVRAEWDLAWRLRGAVGAEAHGDQWIVKPGPQALTASREGGIGFGELQFVATKMIHVEARAGVSVDRYSLPMELDGRLHDQPLRAAKFAQLAIVVAP